MLYDDKGVFLGMEFDISEDLAHYGTPRHSGRYPWGSGDNPYQRNESFLGQVDKLRKVKDSNGNRMFTDKQIAASMGMNTSQYRKEISLARAQNRAYISSEAKRLKEKGMSTSAIARRMELNESSVRLLLDEGVNERMSKTAKNAQVLKDKLAEEEGTYLQVGSGIEYYLPNQTTSHGLNTTLKMLENEGYVIEDIPIRQLGTGKTTTMKVLAPPGTEWKDIMNNTEKIKLPTDIYMEDNGDTLRKTEPYQSIDSSRIMINYPSTGGDQKDGVIELRRGVEDLNLGNNHYAQVRILVDDKAYLKGMAMYADDLPDGVDIRFNTSKKDGTPVFETPGVKDSVLKPIKEDLENPFGANIKPENELTKAQRHYIGADGEEHLSAINIVKEEGDVNKWNRALASQFLSKQAPALAKEQLKQNIDIAKSQMEEIETCTNPSVKAKMLNDFAGQCESDSVHMQAAALPRQNNKFILPLDNTKDTEIYAPGYKDGEQVALVRYPHGGTFEIPVLTVNNNNKKARDILGDAIDAVGINAKVAERLSGADFDGDTALVIPVDNVKLKATANNRPSAFKSLENFDPKKEYEGYEGMHVMTDHQKGVEMGRITNLITDMTIQGATDSEICRATKHSMVVIDAKKHKLDFKRSEIENGIAELRQKYQPKDPNVEGGSATLLSRSTKDTRVLQRKEKATYKMTPDELERWKNGEIIYENTGKTRKTAPEFPKSRMTKEEKAMWNSGDPEQIKQVKAAFYADGRVKQKEYKVTEKSTLGAEYDPYKLVSGGSREKTTRIERIYADYSAAMKDLARQARAKARAIVENDRDPAATKKYAAEVASIEGKLAVARRNAPLERQAQKVANEKMDLIVQNNPTLKSDHEHYKREQYRQLAAARERLGAKKLQIGSDKNPLTDREWEAIQAGAVSKTTLRSVLANADMNRVRELAIPKTSTGISSAKLSRARQMMNNGYSRADIADMLDISEGKLVYAIENGDL